jgi:hypothetical protein
LHELHKHSSHGYWLCASPRQFWCLQVSGEAVLRGLRAALLAAPDAAAAAPPLHGCTLAIRLAGVLGLDALCEACVDGEARALKVCACRVLGC